MTEVPKEWNGTPEEWNAVVEQFPTAAVHKRQKETIRTKPEAAAVDSSKYGQV